MNIRLNDGASADPVRNQRDALARQAALAALDAFPAFEPAITVDYRSAGRVLVVGPATQALPWADRLAGALPVTAIVLDEPPLGAAHAYPVHMARSVAVAGWLGAFEARWQAPGQPLGKGSFDLVLDLCPAPLILSHQRPHGYYAPGGDESARAAAAGELLDGKRIQAAWRAIREAGGEEPVLLLHDGGRGAALLAQLGPEVPGRILPLGLHHAAATGIDVWLAALAYGAAGVAVLMTGEHAPQYVAALDQQMAVAQAVVDGLGYAGPHFQLLRIEALDELALALRHAPRGEAPHEPAVFHLAADKRNTLDYALEHLHRHAPLPPDVVPLPPGAPFGAVAVDRQACSLCMSCVGACPAAALQDGQGMPQLRFIEKNCVQCGLCASTCPENAISLVPRMRFGETRMQAVVLNESQPFHCIRCSKPFGTLQMVENMLGRLAAHPAFAANLDRLRMCGDCRVIDMMEPQDEMRVTVLKRD